VSAWDLKDLWKSSTFLVAALVNRNGKKKKARGVSLTLLAEIAVPSESKLTFGLQGADTLVYKVDATDGYDDFAMQQLGEISIATPGVYQLQLRPVRGKWNPVNVGRVILQPLSR